MTLKKDVELIKGGIGPAIAYYSFVGTGGPASTLKITTVSGQDVTLVNIPDSSFIPIQVRKVWAGGTTCSDIIALQ